MLLSLGELSANQVLRAFQRSEILLFLGSAFMTVGLVAAGFAALRRRADALLVWFAAFALLYGARLWLQTDLVDMMMPASRFFAGLHAAANYAVPIPAFFFFQSAGFLGRIGKKVTYALSGFFAALVIAALILGPLGTIQILNNIAVIVALVVLAVQVFRRGSASRELVITRRGTITFVALALCDNVANAFGYYPRLEPYGFAVFLACLGYVAARRVMHRDDQLIALQRELDVARRIQMSILPAEFPESRHFRIAARYVPMTSVAGDLYDYVLADQGRLGLLIADVSGHGVPAALIASMVKMAATSQFAHASDPAQVLHGMNAALCGNTQQQFVTAAYAHLDAGRGELRYAAAAHPPMLIVRDGGVMEIVENGLMLAAFPWATYEQATHPLRSGDRLVLYTDGIVEAENADAEQFGQDRLRLLLAESASLEPAAAADGILGEVKRWARSQDDDLTLLICDFLAASS